MNLTHFSNFIKKTLRLDDQASVPFLLIVGPLLTILTILLVFGHKSSSASPPPECTENVGGWWDGGPVKIKRYQLLEDNGTIETPIQADKYYCVTSGWKTKFDYNEGDRDTISIWPYTKDGEWEINVRFPAEGEWLGDPTYIDLVCFSREITSWSSLPTGKTTGFIDHKD